MMSTATRRALWLAVRVAVVAGLGIALLAIALPGSGQRGGPGSSQDAGRLISAAPADGTALTAAPDAVSLTFSTSVTVSHVSVRDGDGREVSTGEPDGAHGTGIRLPVAVGASGDYTVAYHVILDDGSDLTGVLRFSVGTGVVPPRLSDGEVEQAQQSVTSGHEHGVDPVGAAFLVVDLVVVVGVLLLLAKRPRKPGRSSRSVRIDGLKR